MDELQSLRRLIGLALQGQPPLRTFVMVFREFLCKGCKGGVRKFTAAALKGGLDSSGNRLDAGGMGLMHVIQEIRLFLVPPMLAAANAQEFEQAWPVGGPWIATR